MERAAARAWLELSATRPIVVFVGGLGHDERKGFDTLWKSWQILCADPCWGCRLTCRWRRGSQQNLDRPDHRLGPGRAYQAAGFTERVYEVLAVADLLVSPVRYEPYGLNVQEALCRGVPALVSARAGVVEHYPPELTDMVLPDPDNAGELATRLRRWRADMAGWRTRCQSLGAELRGYSWSDMAAHIVALIEDAQTARPRKQGIGITK